MDALIHVDDRDALAAALLEHGQITAKSRSDMEFRLRHQGGHYEWMQSRGVIERDANGNALRLTASLRLITDSKLAEQATIGDKLSAQAANRAKSYFLANMSHEIRTPMNGVLGIGRILSETQLDDTQREYVDIICGSAQALLSLINDVLDLSKIEADRLELENVEFNIRNVVYETASALAVQGADKGIEVIATVEPNTPRRVRGDPGRLRQIVINLLGNALKFIERGHVVLTVSLVAECDGRVRVRIVVRDTGIGIPAEGLNRLFQAFSQIDASTTRHCGGTGLGLSIVKRLAELMHGEVGVESELGRGSTFWVTLELGAVALNPPFEPLGLNRRILIVDDLADSCRSLETKLGAQSYATRCADSVEAAVGILRGEGHFDLVLCDESMPGAGGLALLEAMRGDQALAHLPFILMSLIGKDRRDAKGAPAPDAIVTKPVRGLILGELLERVLTGKRDPGARAPVPERPRGAELRGARILLVEDQAVNQLVVTRLLKKLGADVVVANEGAEAVARTRESRFDVVLMDCQMPVMDGFTATKLIRADEARNNAHSRLPIIALTANVMREDRDACLAAGMDDHFGKPIDPQQLIDRLARYLPSHSTAAAMAAAE
jgi:signal transduction histidine kinase/DNA-binding response OmpR family regulator